MFEHGLDSFWNTNTDLQVLLFGQEKRPPIQRVHSTGSARYHTPVAATFGVFPGCHGIMELLFS